MWLHLMQGLFACRAAEKRDEGELKVEEEREEADGNESGLDELMLLAGSRRLSEEPEKAQDEPEAAALPQPEAPAKQEPPEREENEVRSP